LRITDLHDGNFIASGEFPVLFDLETSFYQFPGDLEFTDVRDTGLIGHRGSSGIEGGGASWEWSPDVESTTQGQPIIRYSKRVWFDDNRVYEGAGLADPYQYADDVVAGFRHGYQAILENRSKLIDRLEQARTQGMRLRHLVRHTAYYNLLLTWLRQPVVEAGTDLREQIFGRLHRDYTADHPLLEEVYAAERDDLLLGDIPYFWTTFDGYDLEHITGTVQRNYFKETPFQAGVRHLKNMSTADLNRQIEIIHECMRAYND
jgi:lantibiotic modifying enzyme